MAPVPQYPGLAWQGRIWDRAAIRDYYQPWRDVEKLGVPVHIGECGCYNQTANDIALHHGPGTRAHFIAERLRELGGRTGRRRGR